MGREQENADSSQGGEDAAYGLAVPAADEAPPVHKLPASAAAAPSSAVHSSLPMLRGAACWLCHSVCHLRSSWILTPSLCSCSLLLTLSGWHPASLPTDSARSEHLSSARPVHDCSTPRSRQPQRRTQEAVLAGDMRWSLPRALHRSFFFVPTVACQRRCWLPLSMRKCWLPKQQLCAVQLQPLLHARMLAALARLALVFETVVGVVPVGFEHLFQKENELSVCTTSR